MVLYNLRSFDAVVHIFGPIRTSGGKKEISLQFNFNINIKHPKIPEEQENNKKAELKATIHHPSQWRRRKRRMTGRATLK